MKAGGRGAVQDLLPPGMVLGPGFRGQPGPDPAHAPQPPREGLSHGDEQACTGLRRCCQGARCLLRGQRALLFRQDRCLHPLLR